MKKLILAAAIMIITGGTVSAQTGNGRRGTNKNCPTFVDSNKDGVCDNVGTRRGQGRAVLNGRGKNQDQSPNAAFNGRRGNGTGNCANQGKCQGNGRGQGRGR